MSVTILKRIALVTMALGYIGALIPGMPVFLQWIGKLSAPLFFYCMAWSLTNTRDKKSYFRRLYIASVALAAFNLLMSVVAQKTGLVTAVTTNMFATLFASAFLVDSDRIREPSSETKNENLVHLHFLPGIHRRRVGRAV